MSSVPSASRRSVLKASLALAALPAFGQPKKSPPVIGFLHTSSRESVGYRLDAFTQGLAAFGWKAGENIQIEARWGDGRMSVLDGLAKEIIARRPALVVAAPTAAAMAVSRASGGATPLVMVGGSPLRAGLAKSLARPGLVTTGLLSNSEIDTKYAELLTEAAPAVSRVGFLLEGGDTPNSSDPVRQNLPPEALRANALSPDELERAMTELARQRVQGVVVLPSTWFTSERKRIIAMATARRWPIIASTSDWTRDGAMISYGADQAALFKRAAYFADRILRGTKPGDIPIERPVQYELVVNARAAKALGVQLTPAILLRADKVIE